MIDQEATRLFSLAAILTEADLSGLKWFDGLEPSLSVSCTDLSKSLCVDYIILIFGVLLPVPV